MDYRQYALDNVFLRATDIAVLVKISSLSKQTIARYRTVSFGAGTLELKPIFEAYSVNLLCDYYQLKYHNESIWVAHVPGVYKMRFSFGISYSVHGKSHIYVEAGDAESCDLIQVEFITSSRTAYVNHLITILASVSRFDG